MDTPRQRKVAIAAPNKYELYISWLIVWLGVGFSGAPLNYQNTVVASGALLIGIVCEINALLDRRRMNWFERVLALGWLIALLWLTWCFADAYIGAFTAYKVPFSLPWTVRENR